MAGELTITRAEVEAGFADEMVDSIIMAGMLMLVILIMIPFITQQISASYSRVQTLSTSPGTVAQNVGTMWYEVTPLGQPNRLKMIGENSTGAFEEILISLST